MTFDVFFGNSFYLEQFRVYNKDIEPFHEVEIAPDRNRSLNDAKFAKKTFVSVRLSSNFS